MSFFGDVDNISSFRLLVLSIFVGNSVGIINWKRLNQVGRRN